MATHRMIELINSMKRNTERQFPTKSSFCASEFVSDTALYIDPRLNISIYNNNLLD